jgi:F-box protein 18 (helicase)
LIFETISNFLSSCDPKFSEKHLPISNLTDVNFGKKILKLAAKIFLAMKNEDENRIGMIHDGYLKLYQLSKPKLNYDYILLDEAQDTTPAVSDIIINQSCKKIFVGDPHQQIYTFRGAENAMDKIESEETLYLTNSFRFTNEIARIGSKILKDFKSEKKSIMEKQT